MLFPLPHELGLARLRNDFGLVPVEYPTTRLLASTPADRAADPFHTALLDPAVKATAIGGSSQLTVLPPHRPRIAAGTPKPFFGFSDNANLLAFAVGGGVVGGTAVGR